MSKKLRILLTNDDGYYSDGINALFKELSRTAEVFMVAPDREQSASSHSLTLNRPLRMHKLDRYHYTTDGTPTDCVMLAIHHVFKKGRPDFIFSGINHGANMGDDVTYSGTVAAAIEGAILGIPSIAVSMANYKPGTPMVNGAKFAAKFLRQYPKLDLPVSVFVNINLPVDNGKPYRRYEFTSQGFRHYKDIIIEKTDPRGQAYYWIGGRPEWKTTKGTDFATVSRGLVSISPMKLDFTDRDALKRIEDIKLRL
ncbi:MAG: 5'/3'-nucleotidase SurE [candidate division Zixibacteria bacterium]|nr:5'/3'-nucleotidase SurE [candidate division Zixibacteria bacterium]